MTVKAKPMVPLAVALHHCDVRDTAPVANASVLAVPAGTLLNDGHEVVWCGFCERTISPQEQSHALETFHAGTLRRVLVIDLGPA